MQKIELGDWVEIKDNFWRPFPHKTYRHLFNKGEPYCVMQVTQNILRFNFEDKPVMAEIKHFKLYQGNPLWVLEKQVKIHADITRVLLIINEKTVITFESIDKRISNIEQELAAKRVGDKHDNIN